MKEKQGLMTKCKARGVGVGMGKSGSPVCYVQACAGCLVGFYDLKILFTSLYPAFDPSSLPTACAEMGSKCELLPPRGG